MKRFGVLIAGIIFLGAGVFMYFQNQHLVKSCTEETVATVTGMEEELSSDSDGFSRYTYYPVIEYQVNNNIYKERMSSGSSSPQYSVGDRITILYNPDKPSEFLIKGEKSLGILSIVFAALGLGLTIYGIKVAVTKE